MAVFKLRSLEDASILRKFSVLFTLTSVFPLVILTVFYFIMYAQGSIRINANLYFIAVTLVAVFGFIGFIYMRQSLASLHRMSIYVRDSLQTAIPKSIDMTFKGENEMAVICRSFNELVKRLEGNIDELEKSNHQLLQALDRQQVMARTDYLTGIANRRVFYELAEMEINKSRRYGHPFTAMLIDVDNFKNINDAYGHQAGDALLCKMAVVIKDNIRVTDIVARIGGDEFTVLLTETGSASSQPVLSRLKKKLKETMDKNDWPATFSIGVATYTAAPENVDEVVRKTDSLMYTVKHEGKNNIRQEVVG